MLHLKVADAGRVIEHAVRLERLVHSHALERPMIVELPRQLDASASVIRVVIVLRDKIRVADRLARRGHEAARRPARRRDAIDHANARLDGLLHEQRVAGRNLARAARVERHLVSAGNVVDIAALAVVKDDETNRKLVLDHRDVDKAFARKAFIAMFRQGGGAGEAHVEVGEIGLVGDVSNRAAHGAGAEQRALRTGQHLDAL